MLIDLGGAFGRNRGGPGQPGGWHILYEPELHLGEDILVPDLAGYRKERLPVLPKAAYFSVDEPALKTTTVSTGSIMRTARLDTGIPSKYATE